MYWSITPPALESLVQQLQSDPSSFITVTYAFTRYAPRTVVGDNLVCM